MFERTPERSPDTLVFKKLYEKLSRVVRKQSNFREKPGYIKAESNFRSNSSLVAYPQQHSLALHETKGNQKKNYSLSYVGVKRVSQPHLQRIRADASQQQQPYANMTEKSESSFQLLNPNRRVSTEQEHHFRDCSPS